MAENNAKAPEQESNFKALVLPVIVLVVICLVCSALLAVLNDATAPIIEANTKAETLAAYLSVLPEGTTADDLQDVTVTTANVTGAVKTADGMAVVQSTAAGYSGNLVTVYAAFDTTGTLTALSVDASTQTTGIGSKTGEESFYGGYVGWSASQQVEVGNPVDAIGGAIHHIGNIHKYALPEDVPEHTMFVITTDGQENASHRYSSEQVKKMIECQKEKYGWEFLFIGANIDAVETAARYGIDKDRAVNYNADGHGTHILYESVAKAVCNVRASAPLGADWSEEINADYQRRGKKNKK